MNDDNKKTNLAAHCKGVEISSPPKASTSAPLSNNNLQVLYWLLMEAQCKGVIFSKSLSLAEALPFEIKLSINSISPRWEAENIFNYVYSSIKITNNKNNND